MLWFAVALSSFFACYVVVLRSMLRGATYEEPGDELAERRADAERRAARRRSPAGRPTRS